VHTDMWRGCSQSATNFDYTHLIVNHSQNFINPISLVPTNTIEGTWAGIKLIVPRRNQTGVRLVMPSCHLSGGFDLRWQAIVGRPQGPMLLFLGLFFCRTGWVLVLTIVGSHQLATGFDLSF
jgi:hypothetical protein